MRPRNKFNPHHERNVADPYWMPRRTEPLGPFLTYSMSKDLDEELNLNICKANIMWESGHIQLYDQYISFIRNQMLNKAYPRVREGHK